MDTPRRPRIALLIDRYFPLWGGTENQLRQLVPHLVEEDCEVFIITRRWEQAMDKAELIDGIEVFRCGRPGRTLLSTLSYVVSILLLLLRKRARFDILHTNGAAALGVLGRVYAYLLNKRNIARISSSGKVPAMAERMVTRPGLFCLRRSDAVISMSADITTELLQAGVPYSVVRAISNGVNCTRFHRLTPAARRDWRIAHGLPEDALIVLYASLFKPGKGHDMLLQAWAEVEKRSAQGWLFLVGSALHQKSPTDQQISAVHQRLKLKRVIFHQAVDDTAALNGIADICAFPSESEGCPNALLEAMAAGLAIAAFDVKGVRDLVIHGKTGLLATTQTADALEECITTLLNDEKLRSQLGQLCQKYVREHHDFRAVAQHYVTLYRELTHSPAGASCPPQSTPEETWRPKQ